ncbi:MAG: low molecular weight phosphotyrosine protein phosphatase [Candidatus Hydrogenedens sp.]|nr:low molecular weight phosphotyrosine protein phosphatase [Candidatus Hydrogenedentota bacterium]NLF57372.1 low molecular weight phosphotyrosine protein phosphatase [Candidatus Hydrogenedens sp.]
MIKVLFVCLGNICRSPTAEGVFRELVRRQGLEGDILADSAGTSGWHVGAPPDSRSQAEARRRGVDLSGLRSRKVTEEDFGRFDLILGMDRDNVEDLLDICPPDRKDRVRLFTEFARTHRAGCVPDPYYGGPDGFAKVFDLVEDCAGGLLEHLLLRGGGHGE